jgi:hypothetical protein
LFTLAALVLVWSAADSAPRPSGDPSHPVIAQLPESLRFEIVVPAQARAGDSVPISLRLTNVSDRPVEAHFLGRTIAFDIVIARTDGAVVWQRLAGTAIQGILQIKVLRPGEALELRDVWDQRTKTGARAGPGEYTVQGVLPTDEPEPLRTPIARTRITSR